MTNLLRNIRIIVDIIVFICIVFGWWYVALPLLIIVTLVYSFPVETIIAGVVYDSLFGMTSALGIWGYAGTILSIALCIVIYVLKRIVRK